MERGWRNRIQMVPGVCGGQPVIRGMRFPVALILGMLASGMTNAEILRDYPFLEEEDIRAALRYAEKLVEKQTATAPTKAASATGTP